MYIYYVMYIYYIMYINYIIKYIISVEYYISHNEYLLSLVCEKIVSNNHDPSKWQISYQNSVTSVNIKLLK